jgi:uncharacterized protein YaaW (UPF0174 family)
MQQTIGRQVEALMKKRLAFALLMGIITTGIISFALIAINVGFGPAFLGVWLRSWAIAYGVAIPVILLVAPRVQGAVDRRFSAARRKLSFALIMGVFTTALISFTLIAANLGFAANFLGVWLRSWGLAYLAVIPAILFVAPRVQALVDRVFRDPPPPPK